jgi:hypothetical protein
MVRTLKEDWFTRALENKGIFVGGGEVISKMLHLENLQVTFRFAVSPSQTWMYFLTVGFDTNYSSSYKGSLLHQLRETGIADVFPELKLLFYSNSRPDSYRINFDGFWETVSGSALQSRFKSVDTSFVGTVGQLKPINKSANDGFQIWSRTFLNPYCLVNDIDALLVGTTKNSLSSKDR